MKQVRDVLNEVKGEKAHKQAIAMGLKYKGFGYWLDPSTGQVAYKTENDTLVPVEPEQESELAGKGEGDPPAGGAPSGGMGNPDGAGGSFGTFMNKQAPLGQGTNIQGVADNGLAQAPNTDEGRWEPGPDGDNFVNDQTLKDTNKPPKDSFVGKTNYYGWTAGPDGDNMTTLTMDDMLKAAMNVNNKNAKVYEETEQQPMGHRTMFQKMIGMKDPSANDPSHVARAAQAYQQQSDTGKGEMMQAAVRGGNNTGAMNVAMDRLPARMAARNDRKSKINQINASLKELVQDPNYDMSQKGEELGSGMFGSVYDSADGKNVIKEGKVTPVELAVLNKLRDVKAFPNLINAEVTSPFQSANDVFGTDDEPDSMNDGMAFFDDIPFADAKVVMSKMAGQPYSDVEGDLTEEQKQQFVQKLWNARKQMHELGISHNDMHGQNFFIDDAGNPSILDMGLASEDPLTALMEALGGVSGEDYQLDSDAKMGGGPLASLMGGGFNFVPGALKGKLGENLKKVREMFDDEAADYLDPPDDPDDPDDYNAQEMHAWGQRADKLMKGGLRLKADELKEMRQNMPFLEDNDKVLGMIKQLYENVQDTETGQRMSNAFDKLQQDRLTVARANLMRRNRGQPEIVDKLKDVIEPDD